MDADQLLRNAAANRERSGHLEGLDISEIPFSKVEHFDYNHGLRTQMLAHELAAQWLEVTNIEQLRIVKTAALLHDLGREMPWQQADEYCGRRSAELAVKTLRAKKDTWWQQSLIAQVERIIGAHSLGNAELPHDPSA